MSVLVRIKNFRLNMISYYLTIVKSTKSTVVLLFSTFSTE